MADLVAWKTARVGGRSPCTTWYALADCSARRFACCNPMTVASMKGLTGFLPGACLTSLTAAMNLANFESETLTLCITLFPTSSCICQTRAVSARYELGHAYIMCACHDAMQQSCIGMAYFQPAPAHILAKRAAKRCQSAVQVADGRTVPALLAESDAALLAAPYILSASASA